MHASPQSNIQRWYELWKQNLLKGYLGAVFVSVSISLSSRILLANYLSKLKGSKMILANAFLGYLAAAIPGTSNLVIMRFKEMQEGIKVQNKEGDVTYGVSKVAAKKAILETAVSRFVMPLPVLFFPTLVNMALERGNLWPKNNKVSKALELFLCICSLTFALPMSVALFH